MAPLLLLTRPLQSDFYRLMTDYLSGSHAAILDTSVKNGQGASFSYAFPFEPYAIITARRRQCALTLNGVTERFDSDPLELLDTYLKKWKMDIENPPAPFFGGALTVFGYELRHLFEKLKPDGLRKDRFPDLYASFYDAIVICDHSAGTVSLCVTDPVGLGKTHLGKRFDECRIMFEKILDKQTSETGSNVCRFTAGYPVSNFTIDSYCRAVHDVLYHIRNGDIYQANLSQAFEFEFSGEPLALYEKLREASPSVFGAFVRMGGRTLISSSPERFVKKCGSKVITSPIKGTRPRGSTPEEDRRLAVELMNSAKDRAELSMIVDLERNDLGRVAVAGSVVVKENPVLNSHANVHHLSANIEAELKEGKTAIDIIRATFPGGSITGAPKIRAMDIISRLEPTSRSLYTGSLGWICFNGDMDSNLLIRSITIEESAGRFQVGGGIVADSNPDAEYQETLDKARGILKALGCKEGDIYG
ncbi:MAG: aminodeoxychorismate synthase component I [Fibrobacteres bacterium]|nr:aminodeoxychorismate synthase component I [Fibrobacterota bacterium]